jgi:hypothetical protein
MAPRYAKVCLEVEGHTFAERFIVLFFAQRRSAYRFILRPTRGKAILPALFAFESDWY